jgi:YegS/Rv2252/BmrU family lipid kinase
MSGFAVVNPKSAGGRTGRDWRSLSRALNAVYPSIEIAMTRRRGDATMLVREALKDGHAEIVAVGGDGTINEAVNGMFDAVGPIAPDAVFAFVTSGTGGDFRKTFGIDAGPLAALARLKTAKVRPIDVGRVSCVGPSGEAVVRHFVNIASFGLSGVIVERVNRARLFKLFGGTFAFGFHSALAMMRFRPHPVRLHIEGSVDEIARIATVAVANGRYFGGGMKVAPDALPDDGLFDVVVLSGGNAVGDLKLLYTGEHLGRPGVEVHQAAKIVVAPVLETRRRPVFIETDGESAGRLPATFEILPWALNLRC